MRTLPGTVAAFLFFTFAAFAAGPEKLTDISAAMTKAKAEHKLLFLQMGREDCENCQALRAMINKKQVQLPASQFVYADVNCDDAATMKAFRRNFKVIGSTLPFVVVASPEGKQLAAKSGGGTSADFTTLIEKAQQKAGMAAPKP